MSRVLWITIFCLCATSLLAQRYKEKHIKKDLQHLEGFENAYVGFALYDPEQDKMLASQFADKYMTPASNTKLFTFLGYRFLDSSPIRGLLLDSEYRLLGFLEFGLSTDIAS